MRYRGLSLVETIISIFMLIAGFLVMIRLFHASLQYQSLVNARTIGALLAERQMEIVRGWSKKVHVSPGGTQAFTDWSGCPGAAAPVVDPNYPGYTVRVDSARQNVYTPCSQFENQQGAAARILTNSTRLVNVTVVWGIDMSQQFGLVSLVTIPTGEPKSSNPVTVGSIGALAPDAKKTVSAYCENANNQILNDVLFLWDSGQTCPPVGITASVGSGVGEGAPTRDGRSATIANYVYDTIPNSLSNITHAPGSSLFIATGRYRGKRVVGASHVSF